MTNDEIVDQWFLETFHGQPLPVELFNRFNAARDELKRRLRGSGDELRPMRGKNQFLVGDGTEKNEG